MWVGVGWKAREEGPQLKFLSRSCNTQIQGAFTWLWISQLFCSKIYKFMIIQIGVCPDNEHWWLESFKFVMFWEVLLKTGSLLTSFECPLNRGCFALHPRKINLNHHLSFLSPYLPVLRLNPVAKSMAKNSNTEKQIQTSGNTGRGEGKASDHGAACTVY